MPVVLRGLAVINEIANRGDASSCAAIAESIGFSKSTLHRILQQAVEEGYVDKDLTSGDFALAAKSRELARSILHNDSLHAARHQILKNLSKKVNETCNFTIQDGFDIVYIDRVESNWPIRIQVSVGSKFPMHCTASGKTFLAHMPKEHLIRYFNSVELTKYSANTLTDRAALEQEIEKIRMDKVSFDDEEFIPGMVAVAVPVFSNEGAVLYTIAIHAPTLRISLKSLEGYVSTLQEAAKKMSRLA